MITGEERLREYLGGLYGDVGSYEGRPTDSQAARTDALARELDDVIREFTDLTAKQLPALNRSLEAKQLGAIQVIAEDDWRKTDSAAGGGTKGQFPHFTLPNWGSLF